MTMRTASSGGVAVRWAYGVLLTLCVALAVLVHHETSATGAPSMSASMSASAHAVRAMPDDASQTISQHSSHSVDSGGCATPGMQHCTTAGVGSVQLAVPDHSDFDPLASLRQAAAGRVPANAVGRAPPDLSVLSQLRM